MQQVQAMRAWRNFTLFLMIVLAVVGIWAVSAELAPKHVTIGAAVPDVDSAAVSPMELMVLRGKLLPASIYVEPF